jgi:hypothetical protein
MFSQLAKTRCCSSTNDRRFRGSNCRRVHPECCPFPSVSVVTSRLRQCAKSPSFTKYRRFHQRSNPLVRLTVFGSSPRCFKQCSQRAVLALSDPAVEGNADRLVFVAISLVATILRICWSTPRKTRTGRSWLECDVLMSKPESTHCKQAENATLENMGLANPVTDPH